jgi:hypothetical protein
MLFVSTLFRLLKRGGGLAVALELIEDELVVFTAFPSSKCLQ